MKCRWGLLRVLFLLPDCSTLLASPIPQSGSQALPQATIPLCAPSPPQQLSESPGPLTIRSRLLCLLLGKPLPQLGLSFPDYIMSELGFGFGLSVLTV